MNGRDAMPATLRRTPRDDVRFVATDDFAAMPARTQATAAGIASMPPALRLEIERITLDGPTFSALQIQQLQSSIECELTQLARMQPYAARSGAHERLPAPAWRCDAGTAADPLRLGMQIARGIHAALVGIA